MARIIVFPFLIIFSTMIFVLIVRQVTQKLIHKNKSSLRMKKPIPFPKLLSVIVVSHLICGLALILSTGFHTAEDNNQAPFLNKAIIS
jgi:formate-dependent nitrite reductase membrane component NrfD